MFFHVYMSKGKCWGEISVTEKGNSYFAKQAERIMFGSWSGIWDKIYLLGGFHAWRLWIGSALAFASFSPFFLYLTLFGRKDPVVKIVGIQRDQVARVVFRQFMEINQCMGLSWWGSLGWSLGDIHGETLIGEKLNNYYLISIDKEKKRDCFVYIPHLENPWGKENKNKSICLHTKSVRVACDLI